MIGALQAVSFPGRRAGQTIERQFALLETNPDIGRPLDDLPELRELVVAFGDSDYVALYQDGSRNVHDDRFGLNRYT